jgi:hypothetical protein
MPYMEPRDSEATLTERILALNRQLLREYVKGLTSDNPRVRKKSARGLGRLASLAAEAIPALEPCLTDRDPRVRDAAAWALDAIRERT